MRRYVVLIGLIGVLPLSIVAFFYQDFLRAHVWHSHNGDFVAIGSHRMRIPRSWQPVGASDDLIAPLHEGTVIVRTAKVTWSQNGSAIRFEPDARTAKSDAAAFNVMQRLVEVTMQDKDISAPEPPSLIAIPAKSTFYCMRQVYYDHEVNLRCIAAGFEYTISSTGVPKNEDQVRAMIAAIE